MIKVLVTGDRNWVDEDMVFRAILDHQKAFGEKFFVIHGDARGADAAARAACHMLALPQLIVPARWATHHRAAGPIRNRWMLQVLLDGDQRQANVMAFHDNLKASRGTRDMIHACLEKGIAVLHYYHDEAGNEKVGVINDVSKV